MMILDAVTTLHFLADNSISIYSPTDKNSNV